MKRRPLFRHRPEGPRPGLDVGALAPMVDMMTLLLVFLLRSYATEPAPAPPDGPFELAGTVSEDPRRGGVELLVSPEAIWVNGDRVAAIAYLEEGVLIRPMYDRLLQIRGKSRAEVHADRRVPWSVLKRVLYTTRAAGIAELELVAANRASL